jgi:quercetin dioxygenase-like cupin family protein
MSDGFKVARILKVNKMKIARLEDMLKGWFVGDFQPTLLKTQEFEVAVKTYKQGDIEKRHHHRRATEITVIAFGKVRMNNIEYVKGDIIVIEPLESTDFEALEDTITTVVKYPGVANDKFEGYAHD